MANNNESKGTGILFGVILMLLIIALKFVKWFIVVIVYGILVIISIVYRTINGKKKKTKVYETTNYKVEPDNELIEAETDNLRENEIRQAKKCTKKEMVNNKADNIEKEYKEYGLGEDEIKVAKEGIYDKWDFEEEEMDEDSYYNEDDNEDDNGENI